MMNVGIYKVVFQKFSMINLRNILPTVDCGLIKIIYFFY